MIEPSWKRLCGISVQDEGQIGAVWVAVDPMTDAIHLYDACVFRLEVISVIAEGLNARGRWVPIAWEKSAKAMRDKLEERGCRTMSEPYDETPAIAEVISRDIWERMRSGRFKVDKRLQVWLDEFKSFQRVDGKIPEEGYPLQAATRAAVSQAQHGKRMESRKLNKPQAARIAMI